jgi:sarcosine oxidase subunit gamma
MSRSSQPGNQPGNQRNSPLYQLIGQPGAPLALAERAFLCHLNLRGKGDDAAFADAVRAVAGVAPPVQANTVARADTVTIFWLGPNEWQVQAPGENGAALFAQLRAALAGQFAAVTDVSDGYTVIVLENPDAAGLLSRGCPLDLDVSVFPVGTCAQSVFSKASVLLSREAEQRFAIVVRRSFAPYLYHALQQAGRTSAT